MFIYHTHVNSETHVTVADLLPTLHYKATTTSSRRNTMPKLRQQATPGYIPFSSYIFICYTPTSHTTESYRRRNFSLRNCQAFPIKTTRHQNTLTNKHVNKTRQQNTLTWQHGKTLPRLIKIAHLAPQ